MHLNFERRDQSRVKGEQDTDVYRFTPPGWVIALRSVCFLVLISCRDRVQVVLGKSSGDFPKLGFNPGEFPRVKLVYGSLYLLI